MRKLLLSLALSLAAAGAQAAPALLSDLLNGGSITAGDKLFSDWRVVYYDSSVAGRTLNANNILVTGLNDGGLSPGPGLHFDITGNELSVVGDGVYAYIDFKFEFKVSVLNPGLRIKDNSLGGLFASYGWDPQQTGNGPTDAGSYILETIGTTAGDDDLGVKDVQFSYADGIGQIADLTASAEFAPQTSVWITKNILVWATAATDNAAVSAFDQRFSQQAVPEPASIALVSLALVSLGALRRRSN